MSPRSTRREALALLGSVAVAGCLDDGGGAARSDDPAGGTTEPPTEPAPTGRGPTPSSASKPWAERIAVESGPGTASTAVDPPGSDAWPSVKRDAGATARAPSDASPDPPLARRTLATTEQASMLTPAIGADAAVCLTGHPDAVLRGIDPATGKRRWGRTRDDLGHASPALADGTAFVPWGYYKRAEHVTAVDATTGEQRWEVDVAEAPACAPVATGGTVYAGTDGTALVTALDAGSGRRCVTFALPAPTTAVRRIAVADGRLYAGTLGFASDVPDVGHVLAADPAAGTVAWSVETGRPVADLAVSGGTAYVAAGDRTLALDAATGTERWRREAAGRIGAVAVADGTVYLGSDAGVRALAAGDGSDRWRSGPAAGSGLAVSGGTVYAGGPNGLAVLDADGGRVRWRDDGPTVAGGPALAGGLAYLGTADGRLVGYGPGES
ncbi:MAG: PQQ-binding-like beta-propeller repeat protein [Haloferacaceae archaeon]